MPVLELETLTLSSGSHTENGDQQMCVMEAVAYVAGEPWSDHPKCASPVIGAFLRQWNDDLGDADRQMLKPLIPRLVGTNTGPADDDRRAWMVTDWMVRVYLPTWLRTAKLDEQAAAVESLAELSSAKGWDEARLTVSAVRDKAAAAWAAAWAAARAEARDAARDAAWDAARDAARDAASAAAWNAASAAAWDAARAAASAAARAAASAAAWAAASAAAWDAASAAAWNADWDAASAAARDAASKALEPTVITIQQSALALVERMIALGNPSA